MKTQILAFALLLPALVVLPAGSARAQLEYTPEHPDVQRMAEAGIAYLAAIDPSDRGQLILSALAVVECNKRYNNMVPTEHPLVQKAVNTILAALAGGKGSGTGLLDEAAVYIPSLACILLCDVNDEKYQNEIRSILRELESRQHADGGYCYTNRRTWGDTSQIQYIGLALWVAHHHHFKVDLQVAKRCLEWLTDNNLPEGTWWYQYSGDRPAETDKLTMSIHAAGSGTLYLLADFLQLVPRLRQNGRGMVSSLPPSVSIYVKPKDGEDDDQFKKDGPLVRMDTGRMHQVKARANQFWAKNFAPQIRNWNYYYLYALERYAFFRERAEGSFKEHPDWYDQGVEFLKGRFNGDGSFTEGRAAPENRTVATCFAVLFLVRSSEVLILPNNGSRANGFLGFPENQRLDLTKNGRVRAKGMVKGIEDVMKMLENGDVAQDQLEMITESLGPAIADFTARDDASRNEQMAFLRGLVTDRNYFRRLIAVRFLAREQNMDNVPALLYALTDPDLRICHEAHNGLRLISRKLDTITVPPQGRAAHNDFLTAKKQWTAWFLSIRPDAELLD